MNYLKNNEKKSINPITQRFIFCVNYLHNLGSSYTDIAKLLNTSPQQLNDILKERQNVTIELLRQLFIIRPLFNPIWVMTGEGDTIRTNTGATTSIVSEPVTPYTQTNNTTSNAEITLLRELLRDKDQQIAELNREIGRMQATLAHHTPG